MTQPEGSQVSVTACFVQYSCAEAKLTLMSNSVYNSYLCLSSLIRSLLSELFDRPEYG